MRPEHLNLIAILVAAFGFGSGIWAVGPRGLWDFPGGVRPYLNGNSRAWLYAIVMLTTIGAGWHMALLIDWYLQALTVKQPLGEARRFSWLSWYVFIELAITGLHIYARRWREARIDQPATQLGGAGTNVP